MNALEEKYQKLERKLKGQATFYVDEVQAIFPDMKKSSLYWNISKMVEAGFIKRIRNGVYAINEWKGKKAVLLSWNAEKVSGILDETGFEYYISGLDVLQKYMLHVPEQYPLIVFAEKGAKEEIKTTLLLNQMEVIEPAQAKERYETQNFVRREGIQIILYPTENFTYNEEGIATTEKAFVDLYYAVTRNGYPVALQELVRIYQNMVRLGNIDRKRMIAAASIRSIQYDIRYIAESKFITEQATKFVEILKKEG